MTWPNPDPNPLPGPPSSVPVKSCCGVLINDVCDCAEFAAEMAAAFASPIRWHVGPNGVEAGR